MAVHTNSQTFRRTIRRYYAAHSRSLPWRHTHDPYKILVSEVMLQQTQVGRVTAYYKNFLHKFPTIKVLAKASLADVLRAWQGLGYNRRALMLKRAAEHTVRIYGGKLPQDAGLLDDLPGIGINTAGAIAAFAFNTPSVFIETNIRRVFIHFFFPGRSTVHDRNILKLVEETMDRKNPREWYYASAIVKLFLAKNALTQRQIFKTFAEPKERIEKVLDALGKEGLISKSGIYYQISI
ncbi:MAG: Endonuclease III family protein [Candidatus Magasanikbacteria bacterium GW2011_GWA2_43_9]|nr:MAG: Endonuclease III family protein [Candidatus Magasanikbacteria bacterium GW2011_GWA2_43_9]